MTRLCWILVIFLFISFTAPSGKAEEEKNKPSSKLSGEIEADRVRDAKASAMSVSPSPMPVEPAPFMKPGEVTRSAMLMDDEPPKTRLVKRDKPQPMPAEPKN